MKKLNLVGLLAVAFGFVNVAYCLKIKSLDESVPEYEVKALSDKKFNDIVRGLQAHVLTKRRQINISPFIKITSQKQNDYDVNGALHFRENTKLFDMDSLWATWLEKGMRLKHLDLYGKRWNGGCKKAEQNCDERDANDKESGVNDNIDTEDIDNMQVRDAEGKVPEKHKREAQFQPNNFGGFQPNNFGGIQPNNFGGVQPNNFGGFQPNNFGGIQPNNFGGVQPNNFGGIQPNNFGGTQPNNFGRKKRAAQLPTAEEKAPEKDKREAQYQPNNFGGFQPNNFGGVQPNNFGGFQPNNFGGVQPNNFGDTQPNNFGRKKRNAHLSTEEEKAPEKDKREAQYQPNNFGGFQPNNFGGIQPNNFGGFQPNNFGGVQPNNFGGTQPNNFGRKKRNA